MSCAGVLSWDQFGGESGRRGSGTRQNEAGSRTTASQLRELKPQPPSFREPVPVCGRQAGHAFAGQIGPAGNATRHGGSPGPIPVAGFEERRLEVDWAIVVRRCLDGDSAAWAELVKAQHRRVYSLCYRFTGSSHDSPKI